MESECPGVSISEILVEFYRKNAGVRGVSKKSTWGRRKLLAPESLTIQRITNHESPLKSQISRLTSHISHLMTLPEIG